MMLSIPDALKATEQALFRWCDTQPPLARAMTVHLLQAGGKRVRPQLFLTWAALWSDVLHPGHVEVAALIELLHTATLLHDDVVDQSEKRRGQKSVYRAFGSRPSIAAGDLIFSQVFGALLKQNPRLLPFFAMGVQALSEGELVQMAYQGQLYLDEQIYLDIIYRKTAALFEMMLGMATVLSLPESTEHLDKTIQEARRFGALVGLLFQIGDDVLDHQDVLGKKPGDDLRDRKVTLPLICAAQSDPKRARRFIQDAFQNPEHYFPLVLQWLNEEQVWDKIQRKATQLAHEAEAILTGFPKTEARDALFALIRDLLARSIFHTSTPI